MTGISADLKKIVKYCKQRNIKLIEDCAHALGTYSGNFHVGNFGVTGCFSFYPTKQITTGEGGMLITNSKKFTQRLKKLKHLELIKISLKEKNKVNMM